MDIETAEYSGYCFGVKRAMGIAEETINKYKETNSKIYTLGEIIHNSGVVKELSKKGLAVAKDEKEIASGSVLIVRSHGMSPVILERIKSRNVKIVDATCPFVKKAQSEAKYLSQNGYFVVIIGNKDHPEIKGIKEHVKDSNCCMVIENAEEVSKLRKKKRIGVVVQTTQTSENFESIVCKILKKAKEILIENTICSITKNRQNSSRKLAKKTDVMIVVGGKRSANTTHLAEISKKYNIRTYHIENFKEINAEWFSGAKKVGVIGGASTPMEDIVDVKKIIEKI